MYMYAYMLADGRARPSCLKNFELFLEHFVQAIINSLIISIRQFIIVFIVHMRKKAVR